MAERIALIVEADPDARFSRTLMTAAESGPGEVVDLSAELSQLVATIAELEPTAADGSRHEALAEAADRVHGSAGALAAAGCEVSAVDGRAAQADALTRIIRSAERQLVIVSPWLGETAVRNLVPALEEALARRVQVFIVWGISPEAAPADAQSAFNLLADLGAAAEGTLTISRRSARTHAKLAVADDRLALITSRNLLSGRAEGNYEFGLVLERRSGVSDPVISDLLAWSRAAIPDYVQAQALYQNAEDFDVGDVRIAPRRAAGEGLLSPEPPQPPTLQAGDDPRFEGAILESWVASWRHHAQQLQLLAAAAQERSVRVLRDGEHRELLWQALRTARRRVLIASDGMSGRAVNAAFVAAVSERLAAGAAVALIWSRADEDAAETRRQLEELAASSEGRLILGIDVPNHAKIILADDSLAATSFNPLSFEGLYMSPETSARCARARSGGAELPDTRSDRSRAPARAATAPARPCSCG